VSDWAAINQLPGDYATQVETAINAGIDMVMEPNDFKKFIVTLKTNVMGKRVPLSRIDDAVRRILNVKVQLGLFDHPLTNRSMTATVGSAAHREIARECVRQSIVLLKNANSVLPLRKDLARIHVAGKNADDLGNQCGGWTMTWQGSSGAITKGTTILEAVRSSVSSTVTYSRDGSNSSGADVGIVVVGETPYAEGSGDRSDLSLSAEDTRTIETMKANVPVLIIVLVSGRPMIITDVLAKADGFLAAWLPGTEGQGVADVLFGDYNPTGKLSHTWPMSMSQIPINAGSGSADPLFPYGYGLSYTR
jgi:beta-glucosidase